MCGIAGIFNRNGGPVQAETLDRMRKIQQHRGPDDHGIWHEGNVGFAHNRLSIIDLTSAGHQPFFSDDRRYVMVYNGEVYNFHELRKWYETKGITFHTQTDTEVILKGYILEGQHCLYRMNGMFAFAIWDTSEKKLFMARDRTGVKPFYYAIDDEKLIFASEPKAIFAAGVSHTLNEENLDEWLVYRNVSGENTLYKHLKRLLPGHCAEIRQGEPLKMTRWWNLGEKILNHSTIQNPFEWFEDTFYSSLKYRMVSDVNVGVLLSAGIDSCSVAAGLKANGYEQINTFNVAFKDKAHDESALAEKFSRESGYPFHKIYPPDKFYGKDNRIHD